MMSTARLAILLGCGAGIGIILIFREFVGRPTRQPHLARVSARLTGAVSGAAAPTAVGGPTERVGRIVARRGGGSPLLHIPYRDLALLRKSVSQYLGERALCAGVGLALPPKCSVVLAVAGVSLPFAVPVGASVVMAIALSYLPFGNVADSGRKKRLEFRRAMTSYIDLVALERAAGAGATQSLESAARVGDSWMFRRLRDELAHARWSGVPSWEALRVLGDELRLPELSETAAVMRMSAREGATVYRILRDRASSMRSELLFSDHARAGARTERAAAPLAVTAVVFMLILAAPVVMAIG